jgi:SAM-dependent methyltransferase
MTEIPLQYERHFDFILCHSVFTHLYPNEMRALLRECRRLVKENGLMLSTFIIAGRTGAWLDHTNTYFGNRDRIEYSEDYLHRILEEERIDATEAPPVIRGPHLVLRFR